MFERYLPIQLEQLVQELIGLNLLAFQWSRLARIIDENPLNIYPLNSTNPDKANSLIDVAFQKGKCHIIQEEINTMKEKRGIVSESVPYNLDNHLAIQFGSLCKELLYYLEQTEDEAPSEVHIPNDYTEFKEKLRDKAGFKPSTREFAVDMKNDNAVIQRKAEKLGFKKYHKLRYKVAELYLGLSDTYPNDQYTPEQRLKHLINELFLILPEEYKQQEDVIDHLYGIVFDTTSQCLIFNE